MNLAVYKSLVSIEVMHTADGPFFLLKLSVIVSVLSQIVLHLTRFTSVGY